MKPLKSGFLLVVEGDIGVVISAVDSMVQSAKRFFSLLLVLVFLDHQIFAAPLDSLAKNLAKGVSDLKNKKVAVLAFPYHDGKISSGSSVVSERITTQIVGKKGIRVVERRLVEQLLSEKKLSETGIITQENLKDIGSILEADAIITGTLIDLNNGTTEINARLIKADTGEVLSAGQETITRTWKDIPMAPKEELKTNSSSQRASESNQVPKTKPQVQLERVSSIPAEPPLKKGLRLSNESFPPGRRHYHQNEVGRPKKKSMYGYDSKPEYDREEGSYEDGYADAYRDSVAKKKTEKSATSYNENSYGNSKSQGIQHPTEIGVVRPENASDYGYGSNRYPAPPPPAPSKRRY